MDGRAVLLVVAVLGLSGSSEIHHRHCAAFHERGRDVIAHCQSQFGLEMYSLMADRDKTSNIFFSPLSIGTALAMAYAGSRGDTAEQMADVLHFEGRKSRIMRGHRGLLRWIRRKHQKGGVTMRMTNRMYLARNMRVRNRFSRLMTRIFGAEVSRVNFSRNQQVADLINEKVQEDTAGNIKTLMDPSMLNALTRMVLVNAVYFKGDWVMKFDRNQTSPANFYTLNGPKQVDMMKVKKTFPVGSLYELDARVLELPYKGEHINMMILLPNQRDGIYELERRLANTSLSRLSGHTHSMHPVEVQLPRFKLKQRVNLKLILMEMGMTDLFKGGKADLSGISGKPGLHVTSAVHKAVIEVNEEGTEASAATGLSIGFRMVTPKPEPFVVDRPFIFALRDVRVGATLFLGRVMDPTAA